MGTQFPFTIKMAVKNRLWRFVFFEWLLHNHLCFRTNLLYGYFILWFLLFKTIAALGSENKNKALLDALTRFSTIQIFERGILTVKENLFYRGRYLIALYDKDDFPFGVFDNVKQLASALGMNLNNVHSALGHIFRGDPRSRIAKLNVYFIDMEDDSDERDCFTAWK